MICLGSAPSTRLASVFESKAQMIFEPLQVYYATEIDDLREGLFCRSVDVYGQGSVP